MWAVLISRRISFSRSPHFWKMARACSTSASVSGTRFRSGPRARRPIRVRAQPTSSWADLYIFPDCSSITQASCKLPRNLSASPRAINPNATCDLSFLAWPIAIIRSAYFKEQLGSMDQYRSASCLSRSTTALATSSGRGVDNSCNGTWSLRNCSTQPSISICGSFCF